MHEKKKRPLNKKTLIIALVAVAVVIVAAVAVVVIKNVSGGEVSVYPASDLTTSYWGDELSTDGSVTTDKIQSVYVSDTQQVTEVYVEEGQEVKTGDPILAFDTTLSELELQRQKIKVDQLQLDIQNAEAELAEIGTYRIGTPYSGGDYSYSGGGGGGNGVSVPYTTGDGLGTEDDPLIYLWDDDCVFDEAFIRSAVALAMENRAAQAPAPVPEPEPDPDPEDPGDGEEPANPEEPGEGGEEPAEPTSTPEPVQTPEPAAEDPRVFVAFEVRSGNDPSGDLLRNWEMVLLLEDDGTWVMQIVEPTYDAGSVTGGYDYSDFFMDTGVYYTASEISQMKSECSKKITDLNLQLKMAKLEYERLNYELTNGVVYSKIDGVVKTVRDVDEARSEQKPAVLVSGGGGYCIVGAIGEMQLSTIHVGDTVTVTNWETYSEQEGTITEISEYPDESDRYWFSSGGNDNISLYPVKVFVDEDADLREGSYAEIRFAAVDSEDSEGIYLENAFIRQEDGRSYIYAVGGDGRLEKRFVQTGKVIWGSYTEILGGLTTEDSVAFPYGRAVKDGAKVRFAELSELYEYY